MSNPHNLSNETGASSIDLGNFVSLYVSTSVFNAVFSLMAFGGNFVVLGAIWRTPSLHSPANVLLFGLALSDFGVGLIVQPMFIAWLIDELMKGRYDEEHWIIFRSIQNIFVSTTVLTLTAVSIDRYLALSLHLRYPALVTVKRARTVLFIIWIASTIYASTLSFASAVYETVTIIMTFSCVLVTSFFYFMIYRIARRHQTQIQNQAQLQTQQGSGTFNMKRFRKSAICMLVLFVLLVVCYTPYFAVRIAIVLNDWSPVLATIAIRWTACVVYLNSSLNPLVYCWRMGELRAAMKGFLKRLMLKGE